MVSTPPRRRKLVNSGEYTVVKLEQDDYTTDEPIVGTVEINNPRRKDITHVSIEFSTWRSISVPGIKQAHVEQLYSETLELFPHPTESTQPATDKVVLHERAHYAFTFAPSAPPKPPTVDMDGGHIKHYITCRVQKRANMLRGGGKQLEKNQFQVPIRPAVLEVDALYPDRLFACLESRGAGGNASYLDLRIRCNTHLMAGLPFLVELDTVSPIDIKSVTLSLHSRIVVSAGQHDRELSFKSQYVHEAPFPTVTHAGGHFRETGSPRTLAHGRPSWLIEWVCPTQNSPARLPFPRTLYTKTFSANIECGLTLRVEVVLKNGGAPLTGLVHGITYAPEWNDTRQPADQSLPLRLARSIYPSRSPANSVDGMAQLLARRGSTASAVSEHSTLRGPPNMSFPGSAFGPTSSPRMQFTGLQNPAAGAPLLFSSSGVGQGSNAISPPPSRSGDGAPSAQDYFAALSSARISAPAPRSSGSSIAEGPFLGGGGSQGPSKTSSLRSAHMHDVDLRKAAAARLSSQTANHGTNGISVPPPELRVSLTSALDNLSLARVDSANASRGGAFAGHPTPPPMAPLPPAPIATIDNSPFIMGHSATVHDTESPQDGDGPASDAIYTARQARHIQQPSRPPIVLGVSQDTTQSHTARNNANGQGATTSVESPQLPSHPDQSLNAQLRPEQQPNGTTQAGPKAMSHSSTTPSTDVRDPEAQTSSRDSGIGSVATRYGSGVSQLTSALQFGSPDMSSAPSASLPPLPTESQPLTYSPTLLQQQFHQRHQSAPGQHQVYLSSSVQSTTLGRWGERDLGTAAEPDEADNGEILLG